MIEISVSEAKKDFDGIINRIAAGESFAIRRRKRIAAVMIQPEKLKRLERNASMVYDLAFALGQKAEIVESVKKHEVHPAMLAFGLCNVDDNQDILKESNR